MFLSCFSDGCTLSGGSAKFGMSSPVMERTMTPLNAEEASGNDFLLVICGDEVLPKQIVVSGIFTMY